MLEKLELPYLEKGDLVKVAKELGVEYQQVKDVSCGRGKSHLIKETLIELNKKRKESADKLKVEVTQNILNQDH